MSKIKNLIKKGDTRVVVTLFSSELEEQKEGETRVKTRVKIIYLIKENSKITNREIAENTGLSVKGVEWNIAKLKQKGILKRIGSAKGGHWEVIKK